jgi:hypothetical protein
MEPEWDGIPHEIVPGLEQAAVTVDVGFAQSRFSNTNSGMEPTFEGVLASYRVPNVASIATDA